MRLLLLTTVALLAAAPALASDRYEMEDLEVLDRQGAWEELFEHLTDIRPSKRDAKWQGIAERACAAQLEAMEVNEKSADQVLATARSLMSRYPTLKQSKHFMARRAEAGLEAYLRLSRNRRGGEQREWVQQLKEFVLSDAVTPDLAQRAARKVQEQYIAVVAWPLWKVALDRGASLCKDPAFAKSLAETYLEGAWKDEVTPLAEGKCWPQVKDAVAAEIEKSPYDPVLDRLCPVLKAKKVKAARCEGR